MDLQTIPNIFHNFTGNTQITSNCSDIFAKWMQVYTTIAEKISPISKSHISLYPNNVESQLQLIE